MNTRSAAIVGWHPAGRPSTRRLFQVLVANSLSGHPVSPELLATEEGLPLLHERHDALDLVGTTERRMKSGAFVAE